MAGDATPTALRQVEALFRTGATGPLSDGQLLERFADPRDRPRGEACFAALVDRHGPMVLRVCRQVLGDDHDAHDAAQATFLVLARRAGSIARRDSIASWLHGVARRVASKARVASARRRAHERRKAAMAGRSSAESEPAGVDRWADLHEELGRLPEAFRAPLVLCYLEGLTQEQAAARLHCPLGTVQSRLSRGRDKLRRRLERRGVLSASALLAAAVAPESAQAAPTPGWSEATARAAIQFNNTGAATAGGASAAASLAAEVLRPMSFSKYKIALGIMLVASVATAAAVRARPDRKTTPPAAEVAAVPQEKAATPTPTPKPTPPVPDGKRTIRGVVRDAAGNPVAKAWVGTDPRPMPDDWMTPAPGDIRERAEPFRDDRGKVIPPGVLGKYFETRDTTGRWHPVHPDDINAWKGMSFGSGGRAISQEEYDRTHSPYTVRVAKGGWWMAGLPGNRDAARTDADGRFNATFDTNGMPQKVHAATADYAQQATRPVGPEEDAGVIELTVRPTRLVRFVVTEEPDDDPKAYLNWAAYSVDPAGKVVGEYRSWMVPNPNSSDPPGLKRRIETRLPAGRFKFEFRSESVNRLVDIDVPEGDATLDLPDVSLPKLATVRMVGKPAAEIEATDLDGKPVKLADYRGKVVVLDFWATWCGPCIGALPGLVELKEKFKDQPFAILALHDGSVASGEAFREDFGPIRDQFLKGKDLPFPVLLDRPQAGPGIRPVPSGPGEKGSGRTADTYEISSWPSTFLIDKEGRLVGKFDANSLEGAIEDQLGLPRSRPAKILALPVDDEPKGPVAVKGRVVGPDGEAIVGATVRPMMTRVREQGDIRTGPRGEFRFTADRVTLEIPIQVDAPDLASRIVVIDFRSLPSKSPDYWGRILLRLDPAGAIPEPIRLTAGATIRGRLVRDGRPVAGASIGLWQVMRNMDNHLGDPDATTDADGRFRFDHLPAGFEYYAGTMTGKLADQGALKPRPFTTGADGTTTDLGDLDVRPGRTLAGRVVFADGKAIPPRTRVLANAERAHGLIYTDVDADGRFEVKGLPEDEVSICVQFPAIKTWMPPGYRLSSQNKCLDPLNHFHLVGQLPRDILDLTILFEPGEPPRSTLDPGPLADFKEAKAGPIAGAPSK